MVYRLPFVSLAWKWIIISTRNFLLLANNFQPLIRSDGGVTGKSTAVITASGSSERFIFLPFLSCVTLINQINFAYLYIMLAHWIGSNQNLLVCAFTLLFFFFQISMVVTSFFKKIQDNFFPIYAVLCSLFNIFVVLIGIVAYNITTWCSVCFLCYRNFSTSAIMERIPSKWPRPVWRPPWKNYRVKILVLLGKLCWLCWYFAQMSLATNKLCVFYSF